MIVGLAENWNITAVPPMARTARHLAELDCRAAEQVFETTKETGDLAGPFGQPQHAGEVTTKDLVGAFRSVEAYEPMTNSWTTLPSMSMPRHGRVLQAGSRGEEPVSNARRR